MHEFALSSALFKGRPDLYFCYLKSERLAHVLLRLREMGHAEDGSVLDSIAKAAQAFPGAVVRFAAGELEEEGVLADVFELLALVRLCVTSGLVSEQNALILIDEYEGIGKKIDLGKHASPFIELQDLAVPPFSSDALPRPAGNSRTSLPASSQRKNVRQVQAQGHEKSLDMSHANRTLQILEFIRKQGRVSIKDITHVIRGCSEKTVQRELLSLIRQGLIRKEGERRWSVYLPN